MVTTLAETGKHVEDLGNVPAAGIGERFSPGHVSKRRRQQWDSADAAFEHFAAKPAFARWAPGVEVWDRDRLDEAQRRVAQGVVLGVIVRRDHDVRPPGDRKSVV